MKKFAKITFGILILFIITFYLCVVCILPSIVNNKTTINKLQLLIHNKTGIETNITGLNLKISPKLIVVLNIDSINAKNNNVAVADIENLSIKYKLLQRHLTLVSAKNIYINGNSLKQFKKGQKKKNKNNFELKKLPEIHISNFQ